MSEIKPGVRVKCIAPGCECGGDTGTIFRKTFENWREQGEEYCCWDVTWDRDGECTFVRENTITVVTLADSEEK